MRAPVIPFRRVPCRCRVGAHLPCPQIKSYWYPYRLVFDSATYLVYNTSQSSTLLLHWSGFAGPEASSLHPYSGNPRLALGSENKYAASRTPPRGVEQQQRQQQQQRRQQQQQQEEKT